LSNLAWIVSLWPQAIAEGTTVRLYDRISGGIIAQAVDLPLVIWPVRS
jgi:hypothetical protein